MIDFSTAPPQQFITQLNVNAQNILQASGSVMTTRHSLTLAEAALMDKEAVLFNEYAEIVPVSKLQHLIKHKAIEERKKVLHAKANYQNAQDQYEIFVEVNNSLKTAIRLREEEWRNTK